MEIDLSTQEEIQFRFNQIIICFAMQIRYETEPRSVYQELYHVAKALKDKFCVNRTANAQEDHCHDCLMCSNSCMVDDEDGNPVLICFERNEEVVSPEQPACGNFHLIV